MTSNTYRDFVSTFAQGTADPVPEESLATVEEQLDFKFPISFRKFILRFGTPYLPDLLDVVVDRELDIPDLNQFLSVSELSDTKRMYWSGGMPKNFVAFATDSMGNMFCYSRDSSNLEEVLIFDHDFGDVEKLEVDLEQLFELYLGASDA